MTDILASLAAMGARDRGDSPARDGAADAHDAQRAGLGEGVGAVCAAGGVVLLWGYKPLQRRLNAATLTFQWPLLHNLVQRMPPVAPEPSPLRGRLQLQLAFGFGNGVLSGRAVRGAAAAGLKPRQFAGTVVRTAKQLALAELTLAAVLGLAFLMNYSGATATLGLAFAATGAMFPFFSALLGWLGVFLTGSDTSANALFGSLQVVTAGKLGMNPMLMAAANSSGGVMGKMISLTSIARSRGSHGDEARGRSPAFPVHAEAQHPAGYSDRVDRDVLCVRGAILGAVAPAFQFGDRLRNPQ